MAKSGNVIFRDDLEQDFISLRNISDTLHNDIVSGFSDSNILYSMSSVLEDIVLDKYLSMYNTAKSINISNILRNNIVIESFTSNDYYDLNFPVDQQLSLDTQNGTLTLPISNTKSLPVEGVILGTESNGTLGNSFEGGKNAEIANILTSNPTGMFEYETISSSWRTPTLTFAATLKLKQEGVANGVYIKLHAEDGMQFPKIRSIQTSLDGIAWSDAPSVVDINKADHFIRFEAQKIRYVKVLLSQSTHYQVETSFGSKNRYLIAIREISIKQTSYFDSGEYVSKPFSSASTINSVVFKTLDESNGNIKYLMSADNGARWVEIKQGKKTQLNNVDFGLINDVDIRSIRIKVLMNRELLPNARLFADYASTTDDNKYYLSYTPVIVDDIKAWVGGHITCGDDSPYEINVDQTSTVDRELLDEAKCIIDKRVNFASVLKFVPYYEGMEDDLVVKLNGMTLRNDRTTYNAIAHTKAMHTILVFNQEAFLSGSMPQSSLSIYFKQHLHDNRAERTEIITLPETKPLFVPTQDGVDVTAIKYSDIQVTAPSHLNIFDNVAETYSEIEGKADVDGVNCWLVHTGNVGDAVSPKQYTLTPHWDETDGHDFNPTAWTFEGSNDGISWVVIDQQTMNTSWNHKLQAFKTEYNECYFSYFRWRFTNSESNVNTTTFQLAGIAVYEGDFTKIDPASFSIIDRNTIEINKEDYSTGWDYLVSYSPGTSVDSYLPSTMEGNKIEVQGLPLTPLGSRICFEYKHQDAASSVGKVNYTPICKEYRIELL